VGLEQRIPIPTHRGESPAGAALSLVLHRSYIALGSPVHGLGQCDKGGGQVSRTGLHCGLLITIHLHTDLKVILQTETNEHKHLEDQ